MPVRPYEPVHRERNAIPVAPFNVMAARSVNKAEIRSNPKAQAALAKEWDNLRKAGCWDETRVREWATVAREARDKNVKAHVGRIFEICVEKNSELAPTDPARKYKGRVVFQGNQVYDEN